jgi:hypothetical protein
MFYLENLSLILYQKKTVDHTFSYSFALNDIYNNLDALFWVTWLFAVERCSPHHQHVQSLK